MGFPLLLVPGEGSPDLGHGIGFELIDQVGEGGTLSQVDTVDHAGGCRELVDSYPQ